jgi:hypothetical protein
MQVSVAVVVQLLGVLVHRIIVNLALLLVNVYFTPQTTAIYKRTTLNDTGGLAMVGSGTLQTNTQYDSITFYSSNGTSIFSDGTYTLYGQADS